MLPLDTLAHVFFLLLLQYDLDEQLLQLLIAIVDAELLETIAKHTHTRQVTFDSFAFFVFPSVLGYWRQRADERLRNPLQGNQELLVVKDKVGRP